jgi:hypothetical protein
VNALRWKALDPFLKIPWTAELLLTVVQGCLLFPMSAFAWGRAGFVGGCLKLFKKPKILRFSTHKTLDVCSNIMLKSDC